jgi:hypothetical protein
MEVGQQESEIAGMGRIGVERHGEV